MANPTLSVPVNNRLTVDPNPQTATSTVTAGADEQQARFPSSQLRLVDFAKVPCLPALATRLALWLEHSRIAVNLPAIVLCTDTNIDRIVVCSPTVLAPAWVNRQSAVSHQSDRTVGHRHQQWLKPRAPRVPTKQPPIRPRCCSPAPTMGAPGPAPSNWGPGRDFRQRRCPAGPAAIRGNEGPWGTRMQPGAAGSPLNRGATWRMHHAHVRAHVKPHAIAT